MRYKAVLFDLDGTLLDTLEDLRGAVNFALTHFGYPERSLAEIRSFVGNGVGALVRRALPENASEETFQAALASFKAEYDRHMNVKTRPYEGMADMLNALRALGVRTGVVSNKYDSAAKSLVRAHFGDAADLCLGTFPDIPVKPAPDTTFMLLKAFGADGKSAVYVGDSGVDLRTASNAGLPFIGVSWGFWGRDRLIEAGAYRVADTSSQLFAMLSEK